MNKSSRCKWLVVIPGLLILLLLAFRGAAAETKGTVRIWESDWTGGQVTSKLVELLLEQHMGYEAERIFLGYGEMWQAVRQGDLHLTLEWAPSFAHDQMVQYMTEFGGSGELQYIGDSGLVFSAGYYVPTYVIEGDAQRGIEAAAPQLRDWRQLNQYKDVFKTALTGDKGKLFGGVSPDWYTFDEERIVALGLEYVNVFTGTEAALLAEIEGAYSRGEPILFYIWQPHWAFEVYELTQVQLRPYSDECWGLVEGAAATYDCAFPTESAINVGNPEFLRENPEVAELIKNFKMSNAQQQPLAYAVDVEGKGLEEVVRQWMEENEEVWRAWLPK